MRRTFTFYCKTIDQISFLTSTNVGLSKNIGDEVIESFRSTLGKTPSVEDLKKFGIPGLLSLAKSIERENINKTKLESKPDININILFPRSTIPVHFKAKESETMLDVIKRNRSLGEALECICGGIAACSTCHIIVDDPVQFEKLDAPDQAELDLLDLASDVTPTSRLGCQVVLNCKYDNITFRIPETFNNLY